MAKCVRIGFVSATLLKNTQYGNGSVGCRARYAFVERSKILNEVALNLEFCVVRYSIGAMMFVSWGQSEGHALLMPLLKILVENSLLNSRLFKI
jgi:hypothetical protein